MTGAWLGTPVPGERGQADAVLHVDCDRCAVRGDACGECVISVLLGPPDELGAAGGHGAARTDVVSDRTDRTDRVDRVDLTLDEQSALAALAGSGMVPPLRLVTAVAGPDLSSQSGGADAGPGRDDLGGDDWGDDGWGDTWDQRWDGSWTEGAEQDSV